MTIDTDRRALHLLLQQALEIELFTIGPYLTALYSIPKGANSDCTDIIKSVVMEEMLHMALVANVMNAIDGTPRLSRELVKKEGVPGLSLENRYYPHNLPHVTRELRISLRPFSRKAIEDFREIERPHGADSWLQKPANQGEKTSSIGEFYELLMNRLIATAMHWGEKALFTGSPGKQVPWVEYYGAGGNIIKVFGLADAKNALLEVAQQGEGRRYTNLTGDSEEFGQPKEVAHFYRFEEILAGRRYDRDDDVGLDPSGAELPVDWNAVFPMDANPRADKTHPPGVTQLIQNFERAYDEVLHELHLAFNGDPGAMWKRAVPAMAVVRDASIGLMKLNSDADRGNGPPFWFVELVR
jgi:hypothetical protein